MIIAAYAGTGKTTLAEKYPQAVVDFVCMPYKYILKEGISDESSKADPNNVMQYEWPYNYIDAIKSALPGGKILLIPSDWLVLRLLEQNKFHYTLCYPVRSAKEIYHQRYLNRGNSIDFINIFIGQWDRFMDLLEQDNYGQHIVLKAHQFLGDAVEPLILPT